MTRAPSLGIFCTCSTVCGAGANNSSNSAADFASGKSFDNGDSAGSSITSRWTRREGKTLSEKIGIFLVSGIGKGGGESEPKRIEMA